MSFVGTFRELHGDWPPDSGVVGEIEQVKFENGEPVSWIYVAVPSEYVEDDGEPFVPGEEVEILVRRKGAPVA